MDRGLVPVVHQQVYSKQGYLAGTDNEQAEALVEVFDDSTLAAIVCVQGGYDCTRLLELLRSKELGVHNLSLKRFFGFSDITALHWYITRLFGHFNLVLTLNIQPHLLELYRSWVSSSYFVYSKSIYSLRQTDDQLYYIYWNSF